MNVPAADTNRIRFIERKYHPVPRMHDRMALLSVMLTTIIMAYSGLLGSLAILVFYALWLPRLKFKGVMLLGMTKDILLIAPFPLFGVLSALWSQFPTISLYKSLEYASSVVCAIIIARIVRPNTLVRGLMWGCVLVLAASIVNGRYATDVFSGKASLVGLFGSKNQVGLFAELGVFFSMLYLFYQRFSLLRVLCGLGAMAVCALSLYLSKSASSVLSLGMMLGFLFTLSIITRLPRIYRGFSMSIITVWFILLAVIGSTLGWQEQVLKAFGKSSTLTGRTTLWEKGMEAAWERPVVGYGFSAYWVQGFQPAERLWYQFRIPSRSGFHFHNTYIQMFVELGMIGVSLVALLILTSFLKSLLYTLKQGLTLEAAYATGITSIFFIRTFVENDLLGTFILSPILFFAVIPLLYTRQQEILQESSAISSEASD